MELGAFSISLAVKNLQTSKQFYEKLGFEATGGGPNYAMLKNGTTVIGLFQGMFEENILTFNPGLTVTAEDFERLSEFTDVREIQSHLKGEGLELETEADEETTGAASLTLLDPDGNPILIDQFF